LQRCITEQPDLLSGNGTNAFPAQLHGVQKPSLPTAKNQGLGVKQMSQLHTLETIGRLRCRQLKTEIKDRQRKITFLWRNAMIRKISFYN